MKLLNAILLCCCFAGALFAQTQANTGQIEGVVTDPGGARVAGAAVKLRHIETNVVREMRSDSAGFYRGTLLPIGTYEVTVEAPGFSEKGDSLICAMVFLRAKMGQIRLSLFRAVRGA